MFTGKGEPDERTRGFVRLLDEKVDLPIYGITDPDPYGIRIMKCYAKGSINLAMCNVHYATISIHWLGITTLDIEKMDSMDFKYALDCSSNFIPNPLWT